MQAFETIYKTYLIKLEPNKQYRLGSIHKRLVEHKADIDIVFLYLYMICSKKFKPHFPKHISPNYEEILIERI
jgi:hypothetical protein